MTKLTKRERGIAAKYRRYERTLNKAKGLYKLADDLLVELAGKVKVGEVERIGAEKGIVVSDEFATATKICAHAFARKWDVKVVPIVPA